MKDHTLAIIKGLTIGVGDRDMPVITFSTYVSEGYAASQGITGVQEIYDFIKDSDVSDIHQLNGRPCWVDTTTTGRIKFVKLAKI